MARRGKHEGSIFRRRNGTWTAQVSLGGKRIAHGSTSRAECQQWVRKMLDQIDQGMTFEGRELTLGEYLREWILIKRNDVRAKTAFQYEKLIQLYLEPGLGSDEAERPEPARQSTCTIRSSSPKALVSRT